MTVIVHSPIVKTQQNKKPKYIPPVICRYVPQVVSEDVGIRAMLHAPRAPDYARDITISEAKVTNGVALAFCVCREAA